MESKAASPGFKARRRSSWPDSVPKLDLKICRFEEPCLAPDEMMGRRRAGLGFAVKQVPPWFGSR